MNTQPHLRRDLAVWLLNLARPVLAPLALSVLMRLVALVGGIALVAVGVDGVVRAAGGNLGGWGALAATMVAIALIKAVARYLEQFFGHLVAFKALALIRVRFFERIEPQAPAAVEGRRTGDLLSRATKDIDRIEVFFAHTLGPALTAVVVPLGVSVWLGTWLNWAVGVTVLVGWLLMGAVVPFMGSRAALTAASQVRAARGDVAGHVTDTVQGVREVVAFDAAGRRAAELTQREAQVAAGLAAAGRITAVRRAVNAALTVALPVAVILIGAGPLAAGDLTLGALAVAVAAAVATTPAVIAVEEFTAELDQAFAAAARVREVMDATPATPEPSTPVAGPDPAGPVTLSLDNCSFSYPLLGRLAADDAPSEQASATGPEVLHGVTLHAKPGSTTAIVGVTGSGKSTVLALAARFFDPSSGHVYLAGAQGARVDVRDLADADLRALVSVIPQRPYLFHDTVAANLRLAAPGASDAELLAACQQAGLSQAVDDPAWLATDVGEQGERLSGGERQRVTVARALLRRTPVVLVDEATSQLDEQTQSDVTATLRHLAAAGRTVVVVAHRLSTVAEADQVVVLDAGRVADVGTFEDLAGRPSALRRLLDKEVLA